MKKTLLLITLFLITINETNAQCEGSTLSSDSPATANNSGTQTNLLPLLNNQYAVLNGLIVSDTYTLSSQRLSGSSPSIESYITLRDVSDNSVITHGYTPLTFEASVVELEIHLFAESDCGPAFELGLLALQNESTLSIDDLDEIDIKLITNFQNNQLYISSPEIISILKLYDINGKMIEELKPINKDIRLNLETFNNGLYIINAQTINGKTVSKKIII